MKLDDITKVAAEYPFKNLSENIELQDDMLNIEQLPQLLTIGGVKEPLLGVSCCWAEVVNTRFWVHLARSSPKTISHWGC